MSGRKICSADVLILTGGQGKRLREITQETPKSLVDINGQPFLSILIKYLADFGFQRIVLCSGYRGDYIRNFVSEFEYSNIELLISEEQSPLGTAGAIKNAESLISTEDFIVLNGDTFLQLDYYNFVDFYYKKKSAALLSMTKLSDKDSYGSIKVDRDDRIIRYQEKVSSTKEGCFVSAGVYMFNKVILDVVPLNVSSSLEYDILPKAINLYKNQVHGYYAVGDFIDIGTPKNYYKSLNLLKKYM